MAIPRSHSQSDDGSLETTPLLDVPVPYGPEWHTVGYLRQIPCTGAAMEPSSRHSDTRTPGAMGFAIRTSSQEIVISQAPTEETVKKTLDLLELRARSSGGVINK